MQSLRRERLTLRSQKERCSLLTLMRAVEVVVIVLLHMHFFCFCGKNLYFFLALAFAKDTMYVPPYLPSRANLA